MKTMENTKMNEIDWFYQIGRELVLCFHCDVEGYINEFKDNKEELAFTYKVEGFLTGAVLKENNEENWQIGYVHYLKGHPEIQQISVNKDLLNGDDMVACYFVNKGAGKFWLDGKITDIKHGDKIFISNNSQYAFEGDMVMCEAFRPKFSPETHISTGVKNPLLDLIQNDDTGKQE